MISASVVKTDPIDKKTSLKATITGDDTNYLKYSTRERLQLSGRLYSGHLEEVLNTTNHVWWYVRALNVDAVGVFLRSYQVSQDATNTDIAGDIYTYQVLSEPTGVDVNGNLTTDRIGYSVGIGGPSPTKIIQGTSDPSSFLGILKSKISFNLDRGNLNLLADTTSPTYIVGDSATEGLLYYFNKTSGTGTGTASITIGTAAIDDL